MTLVEVLKLVTSQIRNQFANIVAKLVTQWRSVLGYMVFLQDSNLPRTEMNLLMPHVASTDQEDQSTPVLSILQEQCQNLISSLQSQNFMSNPVSINQASASQPNSSLISNFSGKIIADLPHLSSLHIPYVQHTSCHSTTCSSFSNSWILNTGATDHMVSSISLLTTITSSVHIKIHLPNGEHVIATHIGTVTLTAGFILTKPPSNRLKRKKKLRRQSRSTSFR